MKTIAELVADIRAIEDEFKAVPEKNNEEVHAKAVQKYLRRIFKAERALATYKPRNGAELADKVSQLFALQDVRDAFQHAPVTKAWAKVMLKDIAALTTQTARISKAA